MLYRSSVMVRVTGLIEADTTTDAEEAAKRAACLRPGVRLDAIANVQVAALTDGEMRRSEHVRAWQEGEALRLGSSNQRQRWSSGHLPEPELLSFGPHGVVPAVRPSDAAQEDGVCHHPSPPG